MINKLKIFFLKPSKIRSITSISIATISIFSFSGMAIAGNFLNNNYQTISKLIKINDQIILSNDRETINGINVGQANWILLTNYFSIEKQTDNPYWLMFNDNVSAYKYWNNLYQKNELLKLEDSFNNLNQILEPYKNDSIAFTNMIDLNSDLNYNLGANNVVFPVGITLTIISVLILVLIVSIHIIEFKNKEVKQSVSKKDYQKPDLDDEDDLLF